MNTLLWTQLVCLLLLAIVSLAYRNQYLPFKLFAALFALSVLIWLISGILSLIKISVAYQQLSSLNLISVCALLMAVIIITITFAFVKKATGYPAIHDISSNTQHPPEFTHALTLRSLDDNPLNYNVTVIKLQKAAYPELDSLKIALPFSDAFVKAKAVALGQGWSITYANEKDGHIEAVARSALFRFSDDIVIRIGKRAEGSVVDVRSVSRVGKSDLGANAKRIQQYFLAYSE